MVVTRNLSQNSGVASAANPSESPNKLTTPRVHNNAPSTATMKKNQHMKHLQCRYHDYCSIPPEAVKWTPILAGLFTLFLAPLGLPFPPPVCRLLSNGPHRRPGQWGGYLCLGRPPAEDEDK